MEKSDELRISAVLVHRQWAFFHDEGTFSRWYDEVGVSEMGIDSSKDWYDPRTQAGTVLTTVYVSGRLTANRGMVPLLIL